MSKPGERLSVLLGRCDREAAEQILSELEIQEWRVDTCPDGVSAIEALKGQRHDDLIFTCYETPASDESGWLQQASALDHQKSTPL